MNAVVKWSIVLAGLVTVLSLVIGISGLHKNALVGGVLSIGIAILFNLGTVFMALKETATESSYGKQLLNGVSIGLIAGVLIFLSSWLLLTVIFPEYLDEMRAGYIDWLQAAGLPEEQMQQQIATMEATTPVSQSLAGLMGTFFTSLIAAAIIGIFLRKK